MIHLSLSRIYFSRHNTNECSNICDHIAAFVISVEHLLKDERNQIYGITVIDDWSDLDLSYVVEVRPFHGKRFVNWVVNFLPVRYQSINYLFNNRFFDLGYNIICLFMKAEVKNCIKLHGTKFEVLHTLVDPSVLPAIFGGTGDDINVNAAVWHGKVFDPLSCSFK